MRVSSRTFAALLILGAALRVATITWPGTVDVRVFKLWSYGAVHGGITAMYGVGGNPPEWRVHAFDGEQTTCNYPPVAVFALAAVGHVYEAVTGGFANGPALTAAVKTLPFAADIATTWLLWYLVRRWSRDESAARLTALAWWFNPGALMHGAVLGYLEPLMAVPALAAVAAAVMGWPMLAGAAAALGVLVKPQAGLLVPAVAILVVIHADRKAWWPALLRASAGGLVVAGVVLGPYVVEGSFRNVLGAMESFGRHRDLSSNACNTWWVVTYITRAAYAVADLGWVEAFGSPVRRALTVQRVMELGFPNPRPFATLLVLGMMGWGAWVSRLQRGLAHGAALGAWFVWVYFTLGVAAHENHGYLVLPLIVLAAALDRRWLALAVVLSLTLALNLNAFYGLGEGIGFAIPRRLAPPDTTVWLALINVAALVVFGRRLAHGSPGTGTPSSS